MILIISCSIPPEEGGSLSGDIHLTYGCLYEGKDIVLILSRSSLFATLDFSVILNFYEPFVRFTINNLQNGTYYLMAFEDRYTNGIFEQKLPFGDTTYGEIFGVYDQDPYLSKFDGMASLPVQVHNSLASDISFNLDTMDNCNCYDQSYCY